MTEDEKDYVRRRVRELMEPLETQIQMCDNHIELVMMACTMMQRSAEILDYQIGRKGRSKIFMDMI